MNDHHRSRLQGDRGVETSSAAVFGETKVSHLRSTKWPAIAEAQNRGLATSKQVANVIYDAATAGTDRLRYVTTEDIRPLVEKRRGSSVEEDMAFMPEQMTPRL